MDSEHAFNSLRAIFDHAVELPSGERDEFIISACDQDIKLRAAVESLLAAHDRAGSFLAGPLVPPDLLQAREQLLQGARIGKYALIRVLGEGGHGTVYLAEQDPPLRRRVALKVIKPGMDTQKVIARFDMERQALAVMDHPNIAKVFDAGATSTGHPYFVMEWIDGVPITEFCRSSQLDIETRLRLFTVICAAVHHAHEKGIIHRDLKPGNVLVVLQDGKPTPKIIDFGIAKAMLLGTGLDAPDGGGAEATHPITLQPQFLGTPQYMSPEQAGSLGGRVDRRSDVYSLGALLYELLSDVPPFDRALFECVAMNEIGRLLQEVDPLMPSERLDSTGPVGPKFANRQAEVRKRVLLVRGNLDRIVMKAMEKDATRRYQTAAALASDIERYLQGLPIGIAARPWPERLRRTLHRHRRSFGITVLILAGVLVGAVTSDALRKKPANSSLISSSSQNGPAVEVKFNDNYYTQVGVLADGAPCFTNRTYILRDIPSELLGTPFTRRPGGQAADVEIDAPAGATVYVLVNLNGKPELNATLLASGWTRLADCNYAVTHILGVYKQKFSSRQHVKLDGAGFSGFIIAAKDLVLVNQQPDLSGNLPTTNR